MTCRSRNSPGFSKLLLVAETTRSSLIRSSQALSYLLAFDLLDVQTVYDNNKQCMPNGKANKLAPEERCIKCYTRELTPIDQIDPNRDGS